MRTGTVLIDLCLEMSSYQNERGLFCGVEKSPDRLRTCQENVAPLPPPGGTNSRCEGGPHFSLRRCARSIVSEQASGERLEDLPAATAMAVRAPFQAVRISNEELGSGALLEGET